MDYDHPDSPSPWATSPKATRTSSLAPAPTPTTFQHPSPEVLAQQSNPRPYGEDSADSTGFRPVPADGSLHQREHSDGQSTDETEETETQEPSAAEISERLQSPGPGEEGYPNTPGRTHYGNAAGSAGPAGGVQRGLQRLAGARGQAIPQYRLSAKVTGLERPGRKEAIVKFDVITNLPRFRATHQKDIRRTHAEFQKYATHLLSSNPEALVPALPPASTSAGVGTDEDETRTKAAMQRWLNAVCSNPYLMRDEETVLFVESDTGYSPMNRLKQPATGVRRKYLKQFAPPPDDTPELGEARPVVKAFYLGAMDAGHKLDRVSKSRRALSLALSTLGSSLTSLNPQESHPGLSRAYARLGLTLQSLADQSATQSTTESFTLRDALAYHSDSAYIAKETLTNRHLLLRDLQTATATTTSRRAAAYRVQSSGTVKREKADDALAALEEAMSTEESLREKTQRVTSNLLQDRRTWFSRTARELRSAIRDYTARNIEAERRVLATLEAVRPDIRGIDASGGLSRLGREAHTLPFTHPAPQAGVFSRRITSLGSQGPKGDSWSGVPRPNTTGAGGGAGVMRSPSGLQSGDYRPVSRESGVGSLGSPAESLRESLRGGEEEGVDDDRVDAKNAASRLAQSTF